MTSTDFLQWAAIFILIYVSMFGLWILHCRLKRLQNDWDAYKDARKKLLETMKNPDLIQQDFERGAAAMEARTANRLTEPRNENETQRARIHRPKVMRPKMQTGWNPPSDYDPRI